MALLKSDPIYGFLALRDSHFEAKVRASLLDNSGDKSKLYVQGFDYKWDAFSSGSIEIQNFLTLPRSSPWLELGYGSETVYGIFFPSIMRENLINQGTSYPVKIGRTARPLAERLFELQTGNFQDLYVGLAIHTNAGSALEKYLHNLLGHRKIMGTGSQSEWFLTSLDTIAWHCKSHLAALTA